MKPGWDVVDEKVLTFPSIEIYVVENGYLARSINYAAQMNTGEYIHRSYVFQSFDELSGWLRGHLRREEKPPA